jgi:acetoin utilization protein AcuB
MSARRWDKIPPVGAAMTPFPYFVEQSDPVEVAERLMREHAIRHVPVLRNGRVVGIVSARAPHVVVSDPYVVEIATSLDEVVATMAERRIGSAVVVKHGKLAGILSVTDVCRVLAEVLRETHLRSPGDDAA